MDWRVVTPPNSFVGFVLNPGAREKKKKRRERNTISINAHGSRFLFGERRGGSAAHVRPREVPRCPRQVGEGRCHRMRAREVSNNLSNNRL